MEVDTWTYLFFVEVNKHLRTMIFIFEDYLANNDKSMSND